MGGRCFGAVVLGLLAAGGTAARAETPGPVAGSQAAIASARPVFAAWLLPDDWFGRPPAKTHDREWQRHKSPRTAMVSSFLVPGLGQLYNEREFWALVAAGTQFYFLGTMVSEQRQANHWLDIRNATGDPLADVQYRLHRDNRTQATWLYALTALLSGLQSYVDAHMSDFDDSPLPVRATALPGEGPAAALLFKF